MRSDVIVVGVITTVLEERRIGPYGDDGKPLPADDEGGNPFTDYLVTIEDVLKADDSVANSDTLVLRMFGHLSNRDAVVTPNVFLLPNPGDYLLFALGTNPDGTYGSGPEGLLDVGGETVEFSDGVPFAVQVSPDQLIRDIKDAAAGARTNTPAVAKKDDEPPVEIHVGCAVTEVLALEIPMLVTRGVDPIPSGFDAVNSMGCSFEVPISLVTLELHRGGKKVFAQEITLDPAVAIVGFPRREEGLEAIPADLEYGSYDRLIEVTSVGGAVKEVLSDADSVWLYDPASSGDLTLPISHARKALMFARQALGDPPAIPYAGPTLICIEPVEWRDAGLGCPEPGMMYAQVLTPGFRLVFEYEGQQYEYHTDQDGSTVVECEFRSASTTPPEPPIFFPRQQPAAGIRETMVALLLGKLTAADGCLYVDDSNSDTSYLLVWPPDFTLSMEADAVLLFNGTGEVVARVGEELRISGGEVKSVRYLDEQVRQSLPADCPGPYWIVGDEVGPTGGDSHQIDALLDNSFTLTVGQKALTTPRGPAVEFIEVVEDSRCPEDVTCIQAGRAVILVEVSGPGDAFGGTQRLTLEEAGQPDLDKHSVVGIDLRYLFKLERLLPYPSTTATSGQEEYTATLHITTLPKGSGQDAHGTPGALDDVELSLSAELVDGSPLTVRLAAEIRGGPDNNPDLYCQGWEWDFGDGTGAAVMPGCLPWTADAKISRRFTETYTYDSPGTYEITFSTGPVDPVTVVLEVR